MTTTARRRAAGAVLAVLLTAAVPALAGCTGSGSPSSSSSTGGSDGSGAPGASASGGSGPSAPANGRTGTAYPVAPVASSSPLPALGTVKSALGTFTLTAVRRASPGLVSVEGTLTPRNSVLNGLEEPGFGLRKNPSTGKLDTTYEFSAVTLTVPGDAKVYLPARTSDGRCVCTAGLVTVPAGPLAVYTYVTAPAAATRATITVRGLGAVHDVAIGG